jgi:ABC-2 family transporter protein
MHSGFFNQLLLISQFELKRFFATRKGLLSLLTFAVVWYVILRYPLRFAADMLIKGQGFIEGSSFFDFIGLSSLHHWAIPEFAVYWHFALFIFPMLSINLAADQSCSDRERGTLRFIALRSSRDSIFFGRFLGVMLIQMLLISMTALATLALVVYRDATLFSAALANLLAIVVNIALAILPFTAMMAVLSAKVKSVRQATLWAILIWTFLAAIISGLAHYLPVLDFFKCLIPGYQIADLTKLSEWKTLQLAYIPILQTLVLLGLGRWLMVRQTL